MFFYEPPIDTTELEKYRLSDKERCEIVQQVAYEKKVPKGFLNLLVVAENGRVGEKIQNPDKSWDLGPAQINTVHAEFIEKHYSGVNWETVATDPKINISISADVFRGCIRAFKRNPWDAVGCYNSRTINIKTDYLYRVMGVYDRIADKPKKNCTFYWGGNAQ